MFWFVCLSLRRYRAQEILPLFETDHFQGFSSHETWWMGRAGGAGGLMQSWATLRDSGRVFFLLLTYSNSNKFVLHKIGSPHQHFHCCLTQLSFYYLTQKLEKFFFCHWCLWFSCKEVTAQFVKDFLFMTCAFFKLLASTLQILLLCFCCLRHHRLEASS